MTNIAPTQGNQPPPIQAARLAERASRLLLLILCGSPIALFPVALAVRVYSYLFPQGRPGRGSA